MVPRAVVPALGEGRAAFVEDRGALDGHDGRARSAARLWQVGMTGLGLGLAFRVRFLLPARQPCFTQVALNRSKCNGNREFSPPCSQSVKSAKSAVKLSAAGVLIPSIITKIVTIF